MPIDRKIDFSGLAQMMKNGGDFRVAPSTEIRMGQVIGYDPNFDTTTKAHGWPYLSITLYGDKTPMHRTRFAEWYVPNIGDVVWVALSGPDAWVMGALAGADKTTIGQLRSPVSILKSIHASDTTATSLSNTTNIPACSITTPYLPNRIYRVEALVTFTVSNTASLSYTGGTAALDAAPTLTATFDQQSLSGGTASVASPTIQTGSGVPTTIDGTVPTSQRLVTTMAFKGDLPQSSAPTSTTPTYIITNPTGRLSYLQGLLTQAINSGGNLYVTDWGFRSDTQIMGCNWGASTTTASHTGYGPPGHNIIDQVAPSTGTGFYDPSSANPYEVYVNYPVVNTSNPQSKQLMQVLYVDGNSKAFGVTPTTSSVTTNAYPNVSIPTISTYSISKPNITVTPGSFDKTNYSKVSIGVFAPNANGAPTYQEITTLDVTGAPNGQQFTLTGTQTFWETPNETLTPKKWNGGNGPTFTWQLAMIAKQVGASTFTITGVSQQMFVYDCGVAS